MVSIDKAVKLLHDNEVRLLGVGSAKKIFSVEKDNTLYKLLQRLEKKGIIERIISGKYRFSLAEVNDFEIANFLVHPSYVSLESALSFYGILPQFPYVITSITSGKKKEFLYNNKEYEYSHIKKDYYFGFQKKDNFVIATPEKALLDELYFVSRGLRRIDIDGLDLSIINKDELKELADSFGLKDQIKEIYAE